MMTLEIRPNYSLQPDKCWTATLIPFEDQQLFYWQWRVSTQAEAWCNGFNMAIEFMAREHHR